MVRIVRSCALASLLGKAQAFVHDRSLNEPQGCVVKNAYKNTFNQDEQIWCKQKFWLSGGCEPRTKSKPGKICKCDPNAAKKPTCVKGCVVDGYKLDKSKGVKKSFAPGEQIQCQPGFRLSGYSDTCKPAKDCKCEPNAKKQPTCVPNILQDSSKVVTKTDSVTQGEGNAETDEEEDLENQEHAQEEDGGKQEVTQGEAGESGQLE